MGVMKTVAMLAHEVGVEADNAMAVRNKLVKRMLTYRVLSEPARDLAKLMRVADLPRAELAALVCLTKAQAETLQHGDILHHITKRNADGTPLRVRVSGKCQTWVRKPDEFRLPVKYGLYESGAVTDLTAGLWYVA